MNQPSTIFLDYLKPEDLQQEDLKTISEAIDFDTAKNLINVFPSSTIHIPGHNYFRETWIRILQDPKYKNMSDLKLSTQIGISQTYISKLRREMRQEVIAKRQGKLF